MSETARSGLSQKEDQGKRRVIEPSHGIQGDASHSDRLQTGETGHQQLLSPDTRSSEREEGE